jgi:hypothetical protein
MVSGYGYAIEGLAILFKLMAIILAISVPLGLWKLYDLAVLVFAHLSIHVV